MSALKDQIMNDIAALEDNQDLKQIAQYLHILKEKEEWEATLEVLSDKNLMKGLLKGVKDVKKGNYKDFEQIKKQRQKK